MKKIKKLFFIIILSLILLVWLSTSTKTINKANAVVPSGYTLDQTCDVISLSDLSFNGLVNQEVIRDNIDTETSFVTFDENGSLIFKFKYKINDNNSSDKNAARIHFDVADNKWNSDCSLWMRGDGVYLSVQKEDSSFDWSKKQALSLGMHEIEFGRINLFYDGNPTQKYYVYYKVDSVEINSTVNEYNVNKMDGSMFINFSELNTQNKIYDIKHIDGPYEIPDRISINDLRVDGASIGNFVLLDARHTYSYNAISEHKSVVFSFLYEVSNPDTVGCQFHFNDRYLENESTNPNNAGVLWFQSKGSTYIKKMESGYVEGPKVFQTPGTYNIELGKLYITSGESVGNYYLYMKVNGELVLDYVISAMPDKANLFTTGTNGDYLYDINYMPVKLDTDLYLYKWDAQMSGIEFTGELNRGIVDIHEVSEVGFIINPIDNPSDTKTVKCKLVQDSSKYTVKAALASLSLENITRKYSAKLYYVMPNSIGVNKTYYSKSISTSFYQELEDLSELNETDRAILNEIKSNVLNVTIDEDDCTVLGASKTGDFSSSTITLTGPNQSYASFVLNDDLLTNNCLTKIGYTTYKVTLGENTITLTKQAKKMVYGGSEHFYEINSGHDENMTAVNLSPMASELGLKTIRLDISFSDLFNVSQNNELTVKYNQVSKIQGIIDELKTNGGITDFLGVFWVVQPSGFKNWDGKPWGEKTAPDPVTQREYYLKWLKLNGEAARMAAELFPDINNFETWNEAEIMSEEDGPLARPDGTNYSITEKAKILTDLMYYYNKGIKTVNPKNILTTPSLCCAQNTDNDFSTSSPEFLRALYQQIADSTPVTGFEVVDTDPNNYFQVINVHPYLGRGTTKSNWKSFMTTFHNVASSYGDSGTEIWITEFGFSSDTSSNRSNMTYILGYADELDFITKLYFYKIHDYTDKINSQRWGLYDNSGNIKQMGTIVKNYIKSKEQGN